MSNWKHVLSIAALLWVSMLTCFYGLGSNDLSYPDEIVHAQVAIETHNTMDLFNPTAMGKPYFAKPGLANWLRVFSYEVFGQTPFAARFWPALFAVLAVITTYFLGCHIANHPVGLLSGLALATSYPFLFRHGGRGAVPDSMMMFFFVLSAIVFLRSFEKNKGWLLCAVVAAMPAHAKNVSSIIPVMVFVIYYFLGRPRFRPSKKQLSLMLSLFVAVNLAWIVPMIAIHGHSFIDNFLFDQVLHRPSLPNSHSIFGAFSVYMLRVLIEFLPWGFLGVLGTFEDVRKAVTQKDNRSLFVLVWTSVLIILVSIMLRRARIWHLFPLLPFIYISGSRFLLGNDERPAWMKWCTVSACVLLSFFTILFHQRLLANPFVLWNIRVQRHLSQTVELNEITFSIIVAGCGVIALMLMLLFLKRRIGGLKLVNYFAWPTSIILFVAAFGICAMSLKQSSYKNTFSKVQCILKQQRLENKALLAISLSKRTKNKATVNYYFGNIKNYRLITFRAHDDHTIEYLDQSRGPGFALLLRDDHFAEVPLGYEIIFEEISPSAIGHKPLFYAVLIKKE